MLLIGRARNERSGIKERISPRMMDLSSLKDLLLRVEKAAIAYGAIPPGARGSQLAEDRLFKLNEEIHGALDSLHFRAEKYDELVAYIQSMGGLDAPTQTNPS